MQTEQAIFRNIHTKTISEKISHEFEKEKMRIYRRV